MIRLKAKNTLIDTTNKKYFFDTNAANSKFQITKKKLCKATDFDNMFGNNCIKPYLPQDVQAEILFEGTIPISCIDKIFFKNEESFQWIGKILDKKTYEKYQELFVIDNKYFKNRSNVVWEDR